MPPPATPGAPPPDAPTRDAATAPRPSSPRRRAITWAIVALLVLAVVTIPLVLTDNDEPPSTAPPSASLADTLNAPGYDPDPGTFTLPQPADHAEPVDVDLALSDSATPFGGSVGLSFEATDLASPLWTSPDSNLDAMLEALDRPVLRFGGNSVDRRMWWTSADEPAPEWAEATVTPEDLERVAGTAERTDASVTLTVDLGHEDPHRAADMVAHARDAFGDRLLAVSIGNEPNGFYHPNQMDLAIRDQAWDTAAYQAQLEEYAAAIDEAAPGTPVAGPGAYDAPWWLTFAESNVPDKQALTLHWYPLWDCEGPASSIANPTIEDLTSPQLRDQAREIIGMGADVATQHDLPLWIEETGPTSCPGTNETSRTHAQALWTTDHVLTAAETGAERIAFHSTLQACQGGAPMSPVCATGDLEDPGEILQGRTSFLSLMQLGWVSEGRVLAPMVSGDERIMVHGTYAEDGTLALMIVDMRDPADGSDDVPVRISAPSGLGAHAPDASDADASGTDAPDAWTPAEGSRLSGTALDAQESTLGAPAPVDAGLAAQNLSEDEILTVTSAPGSSTLLKLTAQAP